MSVTLYDNSLLKKIKSWSNNTQLTITGPSETRRLFETMADKSDDSPIKLPLIAITRNDGFEIQNISKRPLSKNGIRLDANYDKIKTLGAIPITINYQVDVYTRYEEQAQEFARNLVFNFINYPKFQVTLPYNGENYIHDANITLATTVEDNSNIPERLIPGQFTRLTFNISIEDAYLFDIRIRDNLHIDCTFVDPQDNILFDCKTEK